MPLIDKIDNLTFCAVGDVSLCNSLESQIIKHGYEFPFAKVKSHISSDIIFCNLENVYTESDDGLQGQAHILKSRPLSLKAVADANFTVVSLANNHILDYGWKGLSDTISKLDELGIFNVGAGKDLFSARQPVIINKKGISLGILAYAMKGVQTSGLDQPGAAVIDIDSINADILNLKSRVNHVIISLHSGLEFIDYPHPDFRILCHEIAKMGASLIIGHHPHVINGYEKIKSCLIAYSLGNFIFDTKIMDYQTGLIKQGLILKCVFDKEKLVQYQFVPTILNDKMQPEIASEQEKIIIEQHFIEISENLNSQKYPEIYFSQASNLWAKINIAVNLKILREQGILNFIKRLPRIKKIYVIFAFKYMIKQVIKIFFSRKKETGN
jgi:poly-gamma-glutamate synthesis protein (capsule biosynthesis protein)